ncbi:C2H2 type zinc-finger-domain-containing protein, partial [Globomyces pollinis-pini]
KKTYQSAEALQNHQKSRKHLQTESNENNTNSDSVRHTRKQPQLSSSGKNQLRDTDWKELLINAETEEEYQHIWDSKIDNTTPLTTNECLFCHHISDSMDQNVNHMKNHHSFHIPYEEQLIDLNGLIQYLGFQVSVLNICIGCDDTKTFFSIKSCRSHMISKGHCRISFSEELYQFYNPSMINSASSNQDDTDSEWETDSSCFGAKKVLNNGKVIGHRSFRKYFNQSLTPREIVPGSLSDPNFRRLGITNMNTPHAIALRQTQLAMKETQMQVLKQMQIQRVYRDKLACKGHILFPHFRDPNGLLKPY